MCDTELHQLSVGMLLLLEQLRLDEDATTSAILLPANKDALDKLREVNF